ncbi:MAG TPA: DUF6174 domain-containing protein [Roseiflexaceae bacterium]|nr:DUF6174 domain-containing protein [Roseiflexaceae bacterium]
MITIRRMLVAIAGLLAGACVLGVAAAVWLAPEPARDLAAAQHRWQARPFSAYRMIVETQAFGACRFEVEIHDEQVTAILERSCLSPAPTVTDLFHTIQQHADENRCGPNGCACDGPIGAEVVYDAQLGYPTEVLVRPQAQQRWRYPGYWKRAVFGGGCTLIGWIGQRITVLSLTPLP